MILILFWGWLRCSFRLMKISGLRFHYWNLGGFFSPSLILFVRVSIHRMMVCIMRLRICMRFLGLFLDSRILLYGLH